MMMKLSSDVIRALQGHTLATAESCTGGGIGAALTAVPGSSAVYKGGIISYTNDIKTLLLGVPGDILVQHGAVSAEVARIMALGARERLCSDYAVSVTGLAGPDGDSFGNPVGTVFIGFSSREKCIVNRYVFSGGRDKIREDTVNAALMLILSEI